MSLKYYFFSTRPKILFIGLGPVFLGAFLSLKTAPVSWKALFNGINLSLIICVLSLQTALHFFNDAFDFLKGADTVHRKGPQRMVQKGLISVKSALRAGYLCLSLAGLSGIYLVWIGGWPIFLIGLSGMILTYAYTAGPLPLAYTGLSDLFVLLFFGVLAVIGTSYLHTGLISFSAFIGGGQLGCLALSLLIINHLRDLEEDRLAGKNTLVVRFGKTFGFWQWTVAHYAPYLLGFYWFFVDKTFMFLLPLILLPLSFYIQSNLLKSLKTNQDFNRSLILTVLFHFLFTFQLCFSIFLSNFLT